MEKQLYLAVQSNDIAHVKSLLSSSSSSSSSSLPFNINLENPQHFGRFTSLQVACSKGHHEIIELLLRREDLEVNKRNSWEGTALLLACLKGRREAVIPMVRDARVDVNLADYSGCTPLWWACQCDHVEIVKCLLSSSKDLDLEKKGRFYGKLMTPIEVALTNGRKEMEDLLLSYKNDPIKTRLQIRLGLGLQDLLAAETFALVTFLTDGLLRVADRENPPPEQSRVSRYFAMVSRLPIEVQMIVCNRAFGVVKDGVASKDATAAFRELAGRSVIDEERKRRTLEQQQSLTAATPRYWWLPPA